MDVQTPEAPTQHNLFNDFALCLRCASVDWLVKVHAPFWSGSFF